MPALGMNQTTGKIIAWLKGKGDFVRVGDPVMEIETDKAVVEVEAQASGVLTEVRHVAGSEVPVGHVVGVIAEGVAAASTPETAKLRETSKPADAKPIVDAQQPAAALQPLAEERPTVVPTKERLL